MKASLFAFTFSKFTRLTSLRPALRPPICPRCKQPSPFQQRYAHTPADDPYFQSIVDNPPVLVKSGQKHGPGLIVLCKCLDRSRTLYFYLIAWSTHPSHRIWPRDMAGLQASMENRLDSEIWRSDTQAPPPPTATCRSSCHQRLWLSTSCHDRLATTWSGNAHRATSAWWQWWISSGNAITTWRECTDNIGEQRLDSQEVQAADGQAGRSTLWGSDHRGAT